MMSPVVVQTLPPLVCSDECANPGAVRIQVWGNMEAGLLTQLKRFPQIQAIVKKWVNASTDAAFGDVSAWKVRQI